MRVAKEMLSRTTPRAGAGARRGAPLHLTREELDRLAGPLIDRAVDETRRLLDGVGRSGDPVSLAGILLVGGSSRIPLVATRLHGRFGVAPMVPEQPELPVALGALATLADGRRRRGGAVRPAAPGQRRSPGGRRRRAAGGRSEAGPAGSAATRRPGAQVSGVPGGAPVSAVPVSGDPGRAWSGRAGTRRHREPDR